MALVVSNVDKDYPTRSGPLAVLKGISLELARGQAMAVMGPSGSGKSTLLYILGTLEQPSRGTVTLDGTNPFVLDKEKLSRFRNEKIGFVFQDHHLLPQCSVLENVLIPTLVHEHGIDRTGRARELLERVGLAHRLEHRPAELSGGERQRVAVARALIHQPTLILADEPTGNLDRKSAQAVGSLLFELGQQEQAMLLVVTHSTELAALAPRRVELVDGRLAGGEP